MNFRRKIKSKDGKVLVKNFTYLSILQVAGYIFPLITIPYLARTIGAEGYGKIAFASAIIIWIQTITDWGFNFTATRDVAQNRDNADKVSEIFSNVLWARLLLCLLSGIILLVLVITIPTFRENSGVIFVSFLMVPGHILFPDWFFQAIEKMKYTTFFNLIIKLVFTIAVFLYIKERNDYIYQPLLTSIGYIISGFGALYLIIRKWKYSIKKPQIKQILTTIRGGFDVFINNLMPNLYNSLSVVLLGFWGGPVANGIYDGGKKYVEIFRNFHHVLSRTFFPFLSRHKEKHHIFVLFNVGTAVVGTIILFLFAPLIIRVMMGEEFEESIEVMQILSLSIVCLSIANTYGTNYLIIHHQERNLRNNTIIFSILGLVIAIPLIKEYTYIGVALTVLICRFLLAMSTYILAIKYKKRIREQNQ